MSEARPLADPEQLRGAIVVFVGPTLSVEEAQLALDHALYLPPVSQGDVYTVARHNPWAIGLIDGYFERVPAVWHKEILWAMSRGIRVFGSASLGALRAAELERFGMIGIGKVFELFRSGVMEDDDEVAVTHGPAESGYLQLSTAMVDVRFTLAAALAAGVITAEIHDELIIIAKSLFYAERTYRRVLDEAARRPALAESSQALAEWLDRGRIHQKRDDALEMLRAIAAERVSGAAPEPVRYVFQHTAMWEALRLQGERYVLDPRLDADAHLPEGVLEELRLEGDVYRLERERAMVRLLASLVAERQGFRVREGAREEARRKIRASWGLESDEAFEEWRRRQHLSPARLDLVLDSALLDRRIRALSEPIVDAYLRDLLALDGNFGDLAERSLDKQRDLTARGLTNPSLSDAAVTEEDLYRWFFETRLGSPIPACLATYAQQLGFGDLETMRRAILREYLYRRAGGGETD